MEKLVLKKQETYKIEVNDDGEYIEFDLTDIGLPEKIMNASDKIATLDRNYIEDVNKISEEFKDDKEQLVRKTIELEKDNCLKMRKEFDSFLGTDACRKIFGDSNRYGMFEELFSSLEPHFKKMEVNVEKAKEKLVARYTKKNSDII